MGPGWRLFRLVEHFIEWIFKERVYISLRTFQFGNLTKGNEVALDH